MSKLTMSLFLAWKIDFFLEFQSLTQIPSSHGPITFPEGLKE